MELADCPGMTFRQGVQYALEACLASGDDAVTVSATVVCRLSETSFAATSRVQKTPFLVRLLRGSAPDSGTVSLFDFSLARDSGTLVLFEEDASTWAIHLPWQAKHWEALKETCAGIGALGKGAESCGFRVSVLNELQPVTCNLLRMVSPAQVVEGDVGLPATLRQLWDVLPEPTILSAGFSCQPYSRLGDRKGGRDPRAMCLPHVLQAALVVQSSTVVLECVQQAAEDVFVKTCLEAFCEAADFVYTEVLLDLSSVWAAKRARWWCILTPAQLGRCHVRTWPVCDNCVTVEEVLQYTWPLTPELDSLRLTPYELRQFSSRNPMSTYLLPSDRPMPTSLHSAACQVFPCPCGCRQAPFTLERLDQGLHAVLTVCHGGDQRHAGEFRHLAPAEMALLNGLSPKGPWGPHPRLADCLIGQLASPLQSGWIFAHLFCGFHLAAGLSGALSYGISGHCPHDAVG